MRVAEKCFFGVSLLLPLGFIIFLLADQAFYPDPTWGFCIPNTWIGILFGWICVAVVLLIVLICLGILFWSVRTQELRTARWSVAAASGRNQKRVFVKSMLYIGVFLIIWVPFTAFAFVAPRYNDYIISVFIPLQGVLNVLVYTNLLSDFKDSAISVSKSVRSYYGSSQLGRSRKLPVTLRSSTTKTSSSGINQISVDKDELSLPRISTDLPCGDFASSSTFLDLPNGDIVLQEYVAVAPTAAPSIKATLLPTTNEIGSTARVDFCGKVNTNVMSN